MASPSTDRRLGLLGDKGIKAPVTVASNGVLVLSGEQTVDGYSVKAVNAANYADRVLYKDDPDPTKNGIYDVSTGNWSRSQDADRNTDLAKGSLFYVTDGSQAGMFFQLSTPNPVRPGTTAMSFAPASFGGGSILQQFAAGSTSYTLTSTPDSLANIKVFEGGVFQTPGVDFFWDGNRTITFPTAPPTSFLALIDRNVPVGTVDPSTIKFQQTVTGSYMRDMRSKMLEQVSILDFSGVDPTGISDSTVGFTAAANCGRRVLIPQGTYLVSDIPVVSGMRFEGESMSGTVLRVRTNNTAAFRHSSAGIISDVQISDLFCEAASGITGAKFYRQDDHSTYLAYSTFERIETSKNLLCAYDGFFIFGRIFGCRDGYVGSAPGTQEHQAILCQPAAFGQGNQCNLNEVVSTKFFGGTSGIAASVDIAYGAQWSFTNCDWEQGLCPPLRARGILNGSMYRCWSETITATQVIILADSPGPNAQGTYAWSFDDAFGNLTGITTQFINSSGASRFSVRGAFWTAAAPIVLTNTPSNVVEAYDIFTPGNAGFLAGVRAIRSSVEFQGDVINSPQTLNQNLLPIGPTGIGQANLTNNGFTSKADIGSAIGLAANAVRFTLSGSGNAAFYAIPSKLLAFLAGRVVTLIATGYGSSGLESFYPAYWSSVGSPAYANTTGANSATAIQVASTALQTTYYSFTVPLAPSSLNVGFVAGGSAATSTVTIESWRLVLGNVKADSAGL